MIEGIGRVSIVSPCRNDAVGVAHMCEVAPSAFDELVVVDNRSRVPLALAPELARVVDPRLRILTCDETDRLGIGYGAALRTGLVAATGDWLVTCDSDGTCPFGQVADAVMWCAQTGYEAAVLVRYPDPEIPRMLAFGVGVLNVECRVLDGWHVRDILSGMVAMTSRVRDRIVDTVELEPGWDFSPQVKIELVRLLGQSGVAQVKVDQVPARLGETKQRYWRTGIGHMVWIARDALVHGRACGRRADRVRRERGGL